MVYQLIYTSSATSSLDELAIYEIAQNSKDNNQALDITGLLLFHQGMVMQVLEGGEKEVSSLYNKIANDHRHTGSMVLMTRHAERREFSKWFMGYKKITKHDQPNALFSLDKNSLASIMPHYPSEELVSLTKTYARVSGLNS